MAGLGLSPSIDPLKQLASAFTGGVTAALTDFAKVIKDITEAATAVVPPLREFLVRFREFGEQAKRIFRENIGQRLTDTFKAIERAVKFALPSDLTDGIAKAASKINTAFGSAGSAFLNIAKAAGLAGGAAVAFGYGIGAFVQKANPAVFEQFTFAVNDLMAVIGQGLAPILQLVTEIVRAFADTLITFSNTAGHAIAGVLRPFVEILKGLFEILGHVGQAIAKMLEAAAPALNELGQAFLAVWKAVQPVIDLLVDIVGGVLTTVIKGLVAVLDLVLPPLIAFIQVVGDAVRAIVGWIRDLLVSIGLLDEEKPGTVKDKSFGASARSASTSSVEDVLRKARESAFTLGNAAADPHLAVGKSIDAKVKSIKELIESLPKAIALELADVLGLKTRSGGELSSSVSGGLELIRTNAFLDERNKRQAGTLAGYAANPVQALVERAAKTRPAVETAGTVAGGAP